MALRTIEANELKEILDKHAKWLCGEEGGDRANLTRAYLYGADLYGANITRANLTRAYLYGANLYGANLTRADLTRADLTRADLTRADLTRANLDDNTRLNTGETWKEYREQVLPALLTAGGKSLDSFASCWECHQWENCPMHHAFDAANEKECPILLRPRVRQFVQLFDAKLIPCPVHGIAE